MTFVTYIYILKENGFITDTKFRNELDLETVKQGENITSYYNETYPLYNLFFENLDNNYAVFQDSKLSFLTQGDIEEKIKKIFPLLINQIASSNIGDLVNDYKNSDGTIQKQSELKEYLNHLNCTTQYEIIPILEDFSLNKYRTLANEIYFLAELREHPKNILGLFVKASVKSFNTFLAYEGIVTDFTEGIFSTYTNEETGKKETSYSEAVGALHYASRICNPTIELGKKKHNKLKF